MLKANELNDVQVLVANNNAMIAKNRLLCTKMLKLFKLINV